MQTFEKYFTILLKSNFLCTLLTSVVKNTVYLMISFVNIRVDPWFQLLSEVK